MNAAQFGPFRLGIVPLTRRGVPTAVNLLAMKVGIGYFSPQA
jgi:hypothetical protein